MAQFEPVQNEIRAAGATLLLVAAEKRHGMFKPEKFLVQHPTSFPFLLDEDRSVTKAYGVYHRVGKDAFNIARPATFVVDRNGLAQFVYIGISQTDRVPVEAVLEVIRKLSAK